MTEQEEVQQHYKEQFRPYLEGLVRLVAGLVANNDRLGFLFLGKAIEQLVQAAIDKLPDEPIDMARDN